MANLPPEVLELIAKRINSAADYIKFRCVCRSWRSAAPERPLLPLLAYCTADYYRLNSIFYFFSFNGTDLNLIENELVSNVARNKLCCGSSHGWLILIDQVPRLTLFNPLTKSRIYLPAYLPALPQQQPVTDLSLLRSFCLDTKIVLSADPSLYPNFLIVQMGCKFPTHLAVWSHEGSWRQVELPDTYFGADALFYRGQLVSITSNSGIFAYTMGHEQLFEPIPINDESDYHYLVESAGDLLLVNMRVTDDEMEVYSFEIFKVVLEERQLVKVENLGDHALFLGHNQGISIRASEYPGCRANCIYLAEHSLHVPAIVRVCLEDGNNENVCGPPYQYYFREAYVSSMWLKA